MKKFEKIIGIILLIGIIFKLLLVPGASLLIVLSLMILSCFYFFFGFGFFNQIPLKNFFKKDSYKDISALKIIVAIGLGIGLSITCIGILYKIQHWVGARLNLIVGIIIILIISLIGLIVFNKIKGSFFNGIIKRSIIIGGFGILLLLVSDLAIVKIQYRNHPLYIKAYQDYKSDPNNPEYKNNLSKERERISLPEEVFRKKYNEEK